MEKVLTTSAAAPDVLSSRTAIISDGSLMTPAVRLRIDCFHVRKLSASPLKTLNGRVVKSRRVEMFRTDAVKSFVCGRARLPGFGDGVFAVGSLNSALDPGHVGCENEVVEC